MTPVSVKIGERGIDFIDQVAKETNSDRSKVIRAALVIAARHGAELVALIEDHS